MKVKVITLVLACTFITSCSEKPNWDSTTTEVKVEFRLVKEAEVLDPNNVEAEMLIDNLDIAKTFVGKDYQGNFCVSIAMTQEGTAKLKDITTKHVGRNISILVDGVVSSSLKIHTPINGGKALITGDFSKVRASEIAGGIMKYKYNKTH
jgi:preprotein translocase subunit SecD